jgi:hypothetical protein
MPSYKIIIVRAWVRGLLIYYFATGNILKFIAQNICFIKLAPMYADVIALVADNS